MATALPPSGRPQTPADHAAISRRFISHARDELGKGERLQASEKVWSATVHALKAIAVQRGWRHNHHEYIFPIAGQLAREFDHPDFNISINIADAQHANHYTNQQDEDAIAEAIANVEGFVADLDEVRTSPPRPVTVESNAERNRLQILLGREVPVGTHSQVGFARRLRRP